jgi:exopolysaccharide production protein ExoQ
VKFNLKYLFPYWIIFYFLGSNILSPGIRTFQFASLYILAGFFLISKRKRIIPLLLKDYWILALIILVGLSCFWSVTPQITFAHLRTLTVQFILAGYLVVTYTPRQVIEYMSKVLGFLTFLSLAYVIFIPEVGVKGERIWLGVFPHQSYLAAVTAIATVSIFYTGFYLISNRSGLSLLKFVTTALIYVCLVVIFYSNARTPLLGLIASLSIIPFFYLNRIKGIRARTFNLLLLGYVFLICVPLVFLMRDFIIVEILGKTPDLTGRSTLWEHLMNKVTENPFGFGQGAFWHNEQLAQEATSILGRRVPRNYNSHSSYIDTLIGIGYPGLLLLFSTITAVTWRNILLTFKYRQIEARWSLQIIVFLLIASYSDTFIGFLNPRGIGWFVFNIISLMSIYRLNSLATHNH